MNDSTLQEIKDRLNVADVISGYIPIKKSGVNFKAVCPFHNEKSPSLMISTQKQIWHCFGCGEGGDVFGFVMKYENLEFKEALKLLADKAGVKLPEYRSGESVAPDEKDLLLRINNFAARYYHQILTTSQAGKEAMEYLKNRGLSLPTIEKWQIGFAPDDYHALENALAQKKVAPADLVKAGVSSKNERGQMYDRFRGRITFPIYNYFGEVVGFSARLLNDNPNAAKYVNSPETIIYNKSKILFGLNFAKETIRKKDEAVIVEGQMDCIAAHQAGFTNTVAVSGTALSDAGLMQLARLTKNLKFCFDADVAGQHASRRSGEMALKQGFKLKLIVLKNVKDPDELIKKSPGLWEKAVSEAVWFLDHYINLAEMEYAPGSVEQKLYLSKDVLPFLQYIGDPLEQDHYVHKMATKFLISEKVIRDQIKNPKIESAPKVPSGADNIALGSLLLQKEVLGGLLFLPDFASEVKPMLDKEDFEDASVAQLIELWQSSGLDDTQVKQSPLAKEAIFMVESQLDEMNHEEERLKKSLKKSFNLFKTTALKRRLATLAHQQKVFQEQGDKTEMEAISQKIAAMAMLKAELEKS
ncbi:MAG TPA: DNA primase [Candidatus Limnocylindria bacterium]|nr:DNA primase [Candidatus Limnocylindria bacterium]